MLPNRNQKKVFVGKGYLPQLYKWAPIPQTFTPSRINAGKGGGNVKPYFCNAKAGSQGQDWITTYVYNIAVIDFQQQHLAYVECDYVQ